MVEVVVFVPGICGSELVEGTETIWPGTPFNVVFESYPNKYVDMLATSTTITAPRILKSVPLRIAGIDVWNFDGYGHALDALQTSAMGFSIDNETLVPWPYDWRLDIRTLAKQLHDRLAAPGLRGKSIAIVAHSMGGLISRYMLEKIGLPPEVTIDLCALVAVPHLGAPVVLQNLLGLRPEIFLSGPQCKKALVNPAFPSAYQLLPHPDVPAMLRESSLTGFVIASLAEATDLQLTAGSMKAARDVASALPMIGPGFKPPCRYVAIAGNSQKTVTTNYLAACRT